MVSKCKEIEQHDSGDIFALAYNNDGVFKIRIFGKFERDPMDIDEYDVNVNELIGLDRFTMCNA